MPTRPANVSEVAQQRASGSRDRLEYRDGRCLLAQQRQQDGSVTPGLSDSPRYRHRRQDSNVTHKTDESKSDTSQPSQRKGVKVANILYVDENGNFNCTKKVYESTTQQTVNEWFKQRQEAFEKSVGFDTNVNEAHIFREHGS